MRIGFIGAGKAGCSLGRYIAGSAGQDFTVTGYYSKDKEETVWAADFTGSSAFDTEDAVVENSDIIVVSTPDGAIAGVWDTLDKNSCTDKIFTHLSGSLSSDVFSGIETYGAHGVSVHPMFAFSNRESVYQQLHDVSFTLEGDEKAVGTWKEILKKLGNPYIVIDAAMKPKYHAAASILSNDVVAVLDAGYQLLCACGFSDKEARSFSSCLVRNNVEHVIRDGCEAALTGPIERNDTETLRKHLEQMQAEDINIYRACGRKLVDIAKRKHPDRNYDAMRSVLGKEQETE